MNSTKFRRSVIAGSSLLAVLKWDTFELSFYDNVHFATPLVTHVIDRQPYAICFVPGVNTVLVLTKHDIQEYSVHGRVRIVLSSLALTDCSSAGIACDGHLFAFTGTSSVQVYSYATAQSVYTIADTPHGTRGPVFIEGNLYLCNNWKSVVFRTGHDVIRTLHNPTGILLVNNYYVVHSRNGEIWVHDSAWNVVERIHTGMYGAVFVYNGSVYCVNYAGRVIREKNTNWRFGKRSVFILACVK